MNTLSVHLTELSGEDPARVFIIRGIGRMGFRSQELLEEHCSKYGSVSRVLVAHSKAKPRRPRSVSEGAAAPEPRLRPGGLGFVVMDTVDSVRRILDAGDEQTVAGFRVRVARFQQNFKSDSNSDTGAGGGPLVASEHAHTATSSEGSEAGVSTAATSQARERERRWRSPAAAHHAPGVPAGHPDAVAGPAAAAHAAGNGIAQQLEHLRSMLALLASALDQPCGVADMTAPQCADMLAQAQSVQRLFQAYLDRSQVLGTAGLPHPLGAVGPPWPPPLDGLGVPVPEPAASYFALSQAVQAASVAAATMRLQLAREHLRRLQMVDSWAAIAAQWPWVVTPAGELGFAWPETHPGHAHWQAPSQVHGDPHAAQLDMATAAAAAARAAVTAAISAAGGAHVPKDGTAEVAAGDAMAGLAQAPAGDHLAPLAAAPERQSVQETLGKHLVELQNENPQCVFIVRRISTLKFQAQADLTEYFANFGKVCKVLISPSRVKSRRGPGAHQRMRPANLGFVVMSSPDSVNHILTRKEHMAAGCRFLVERYNSDAVEEGRGRGGTSICTNDSTSVGTGNTAGSGSGASNNTSGSASGSTGSERGSDDSRQKEVRAGKAAGGGSSDSQPAESSESGSGTEMATSPADVAEDKEGEKSESGSGTETVPFAPEVAGAADGKLADKC